MPFTPGFMRIRSTRRTDGAQAGEQKVEAVLESSSDNSVTAEVFGDHGHVGRPDEYTRGIRLRIGNLSIIIAAFNYHIEPPEHPGETKTYSTNGKGEERASHLLTRDREHIFNNGEDFAVRFSELKVAFDQLKADFDALVSAFNGHTHSVSTTGTAAAQTGTAFATINQGAPSSADISAAKIEEMKVP